MEPTISWDMAPSSYHTG